MRISENMKTMNVLGDLNRSMESILTKQVDLATAKRIHRPSDDPSGTSRVMRLKSQLRKYDRFEKNIEDSSQWITSAEGSMGDLSNALSNVDSMLLQAKNDTSSIHERELLGDNLRAIWNNVVQMANQRIGGHYLFGGTQTQTPPYTTTHMIQDEPFTAETGDAVFLNNVALESGSVQVNSEDGSVTYLEGSDFTVDYEDGSITMIDAGSMVDGDSYHVSYTTNDNLTADVNPDGVDGEIFREIDDGYTVQINVTADSIFGGDDGVLNILKQGILALERNNLEDIESARSGLKLIMDRSIEMQGELGIRMESLDRQKEMMGSDRINLEKIISSIEDTDITNTMIELERDQVIYQAALKVGAQLTKISLINYI